MKNSPTEHWQPDDKTAFESNDDVVELEPRRLRHDCAESSSGNLIPAFDAANSLTEMGLHGRMAEACAAWLARSPSPNTRGNYARDLNQFFAFLGHSPTRPETLTGVRPQHVAAWRDHLPAQGLANSSILRKMTALRSLFSYFKTYGYLGANPAHSDFVAAPAVPRDGKTVGLTADECLDWSPSDFKLGPSLDCLESHAASLTDEPRDRVLQDIKQWKQHWNYYVRNEPGGAHSIGAFLSQVALGTTQQPKQEGVALLTVHSAKGMEFDVVFVIGLNEGSFPDYRAEGEMLAEEQRNAFVAVARSKRLLYLSYPEKKVMPWGREAPASISVLSTDSSDYSEGGRYMKLCSEFMAKLALANTPIDRLYRLVAQLAEAVTGFESFFFFGPSASRKKTTRS